MTVKIVNFLKESMVNFVCQRPEMCDVSSTSSSDSEDSNSSDTHTLEIEYFDSDSE